MEVLIPSYQTHSSSQNPNVTVILKSPGSDHQVVLPGLSPDSRGYVHIQVECVFNLPPSIDDAPCQRMESSQGFSFSGMFSWATEGLKNRFFVSGNATSPAHSGPPSEPCTETPQSQPIGPHGGPIYANHHTGILSSSPPPVRKLPSLLPFVNVRQSPSLTKDVASAVSLSSWAAANSIPFIYRNGEVFVPRRDDPSVEDHERRHELENMLHPLLPLGTPKTTTRESAAPIAVQWLESRHRPESRSSHDEVANNVAPAPAPAQPGSAPAQTIPVPAQSVPVPAQPQTVPAQPQIVPAQSQIVPAQPQPVPAALLVQPPTPLPDQAPTPAVAGPSSALTRRREDTEDSDAEEEGRPKSRRRTQ